MDAESTRAVASAVHGYRLDDVLIDAGSRRVTRHGVDLHIKGLSFDLLVALVRAAPNLVSVDALMESVWAGVVVSPETVSQRVKLLRRALGDSADDPRYIGALRGHGYRIVASTAPLETGVRRPPAFAARRITRWLPAALALTVPAVAAVLWWAGHTSVARAPRPATAATAGLREPAVNVPPTPDVEAYRLYLQARAVGRGTPESEQQSRLLLDRALERDPSFAPALALRAVIPAGAAALGYAVPPVELAQAEQDATRALALSPDLADAQASLGLISAVRGNWIDAERNYRAALSTAPNDLLNRDMYTLVVLRPTGHVRHALEVLKESYALDPADGFTIHELALANSLLGRDADAIKFVDLHEQLGGGGQNVGNDLIYARAAARSGRYQEAAERAAAVLPASVGSVGGASLAKIFYSAFADPAQTAAARRAFESVGGKSGGNIGA